MAHISETGSNTTHHELLQSAGIRGKILDMVESVGSGGARVLQLTVAMGVAVVLLTCTVGCGDRTVNADTPPVSNATSQAASENGGVTLVSVTKVSEADDSGRFTPDLHNSEHVEMLKRSLISAKMEAMKAAIAAGKSGNTEEQSRQKAKAVRYHGMLQNLPEHIAAAGALNRIPGEGDEDFEAYRMSKELELLVVNEAVRLSREALKQQKANTTAAIQRNKEATEQLYTLAGLKAPAESPK